MYNINIATYNEILNNNNEIIGLTPIRYYNHNDNNINRHLMILSNINNIHFRIWYYNNNNLEIDNNFKINPNEICPINKENNENNNANSNQDTKENNSILDNHEFNKLINELNTFNKKNFKEILEFYKNNEKDDIIGLYDIYLYIKTFNENNNEKGEYSNKFINKYKNDNLKSKKLLFDKKSKK